MTEKLPTWVIDSFEMIAEKRGLTLQEAFIEAVDLWIKETKRRNENAE